jgi:hypothetical protein
MRPTTGVFREGRRDSYLPIAKPLQKGVVSAGSTLVPLKAAVVEFQRAAVLGDDAHDLVGRAVGNVGKRSLSIVCPLQSHFQSVQATSPRK